MPPVPARPVGASGGALSVVPTPVEPVFGIRVTSVLGATMADPLAMPRLLATLT